MNKIIFNVQRFADIGNIQIIRLLRERQTLTALEITALIIKIKLGTQNRIRL